MQKVKKAAAQLDSRAAVSVLNNLKNNQIVIENYDIFCELYEKAIACEDCGLAPLFSDGSLIVKQKINDDCIDLIINFSVNFTEKGSVLADLECLRLDFLPKMDLVKITQRRRLKQLKIGNSNLDISVK